MIFIFKENDAVLNDLIDNLVIMCLDVFNSYIKMNNMILISSQEVINIIRKNIVFLVENLIVKEVMKH